MVWGDNLIDHSQLPLAKGFLQETAGDCFVGFC
jgi:hypothetical protein